MKLMPHQMQALKLTQSLTKVAYYYDMGLGKTYIGSEKLAQLHASYNLVVCQKSKLKDWYEHFKEHYPNYNIVLYKDQSISDLPTNSIIIINYDSVWRRSELLNLNKKKFTLLLDESQYIKNDNSNRGNFILRKLKPTNVILLSGTPIGGKYEELWSQCQLLGWYINKAEFWFRYIVTENIDVGLPYTIPVVIGYRNIDHLKAQLYKYGARFLKSEEVLTLPEQVIIDVIIDSIPEYKTFQQSKIVSINNKVLVGETGLTQLLYSRQLSGMYNKHKYEYLNELLESTNDRVIIFYNFKEEFINLNNLISKLKKPISYVNGQGTNLLNYDKNSNSVTLVQYQSGSTGLNLQKSNKIIYFSPPLSADLWMQSAKRIHRIGQSNTCFYYYLISKNTVEKPIIDRLKLREDYTLALFEKVS